MIAVILLILQGQYEDEETGLYYNRYRYYDPDVGRYVTQDPVGLEGGVNLYIYAPGPTGWVDPLGLARKKKKNGPCSCAPKSEKRQDKLSDPNPVPKSIREAYEEIKLGRGTPNLDNNGVQKIY